MENKLVVVFDLDDTLYYEIDFLKSAFLEIATELNNHCNEDTSIETLFSEMMSLYFKGENVFLNILKKFNIKNTTVDALVEKYRKHKPTISLTTETIHILEFLKEKNVVIGLITDGRSLQQRSKIEALKLNNFLSYIVISEEIGSEKPNLNNYLVFEDTYKKEGVQFIYVGDNIKKDFVTPNKLGWHTVCLLDKGFNIHSQKVTVLQQFRPKSEIRNISELKDIVNKIF